MSIDKRITALEEKLHFLHKENDGLRQEAHRLREEAKAAKVVEMELRAALERSEQETRDKCARLDALADAQQETPA